MSGKELSTLNRIQRDKDKSTKSLPVTPGTGTMNASVLLMTQKICKQPSCPTVQWTELCLPIPIHGIWSHHFMANRWETVETVSDFILPGFKITADGDCSHEIKRRLLLGRKALTNLDNILKSRDITLSTKVHLVKAMVFPVVMLGCESWTIKKAEHQRIDAFELGCWRRFLRVSWTARRSTQSILKEISPEYSLEGLMLKLKLQQYFVHLM